MSAQEEKKTTPANKASQRPATADIATILLEIRDLVRFHERLGIDYYPATAELRLFLKKKSSPETRGSGSRVAQPWAAAGQYPPDKSASRTSPPPPSSQPAKTRPPREQGEIEPLQQEIQACALCPPANTPRNILTGRGSRTARLMIVGDRALPGRGPDGTDLIFGPGEDEMLWKMMAAIGESPASVYVTNCVKCCAIAENNADPHAEQNCPAFLEKEIAIIRPALICAMGEKATRILLGSREPLLRLRGSFYPRRSRLTGEISYVIPTFHPRFLLRNNAMKKVTWADLQAIQKRLAKK